MNAEEFCHRADCAGPRIEEMCLGCILGERESLEQQLAEREKQIVMLREHAKAIRGHMKLYRLFSCEGSDSYDPEYAEKNLDKVSEHAEALAATADLSGCILCDAKPSAFSYRPYISAEYEHESSGWSNSLFYNDHAPKNAKDVNPLYKAKEQK